MGRIVCASLMKGFDTIVYDPCSGSVYKTNDNLAEGRNYVPEDFFRNRIPVSPNKIETTYPISICWSPIVRCNLGCFHCLDDKSVVELNRQGQQLICEVICKSRILGVDISGGEPLLARNLPLWIEKLRGSNKVVSMTTNCTYLPKRINEIENLVDALRVSLDSPIETIHDKIRGAGNYKEVIAGIRLAKQKKISVQIQTVLMESTIKDIPELIDLAYSEGVNGVTLLQFLPIGEGIKVKDHEMLSDEFVATELSKIKYMFPQFPIRIRYHSDAESFTVVRSDGYVYRNQKGAKEIKSLHKLTDITSLNGS